MTGEQKRQWAIIIWYVYNCQGSFFDLGERMALSGMTSKEFDEIMEIKNSFTQQPNP